MQVNLKVTSGPYKGRIFSFTQHDTFLIGRSPDAHLCLPEDRYFSRNHCLLEMNPPHSYLRDLGSTNGTFLNGQRVKDAFLNNGDRIQCGETILVVEVTTTAPAALSETTQDAGIPKRPVLVMVECLNCGRREQAQASAPDEHLTFLCEDCRIELKRSPQAIPGYDTVKLLGRGGMGCVMLGREQRTGRAVAIKTLLPEFAVSDKAMRRFMREIDVAASLKHRNIVEFIDRGTHNGVVYLVTEFVDGSDASKLAENQGGRLAYEDGISIIAQALDALSFAHAQGYIHRDFKDQNILVSGSSPNLIAKLTDFGLAKSFTQSGLSGVTMAGEMAGTLAYMPPEQLRNFRDVKPQSDIYAVGMTAYSLLTGFLALNLSKNSSVNDTIRAIFEQPTVPLHERTPHIPRPVCEIIDRALAKDPAQRWQSAGAMRNALLHSI
ncbi:MAG TPA: FHA domain-containing serine/threonine-protein kinase [Pyrinomonadaceae bacterium]|jgi:eukaryotic-like serine/threonine-protein kinase|nr:FHA domain-containing serine/threonine-protein kinase [Pyrinomonadaceae bacterium]